MNKTALRASIASIGITGAGIGYGVATGLPALLGQPASALFFALGYVIGMTPLAAWMLYCDSRLQRGADKAGPVDYARLMTSIDRMMIGTAEASSFMNSIKRKIESELASTEAIAAEATRIASATQELVGNAKGAFSAASQVRQESKSGMASMDMAQQAVEQVNAHMTDLHARNQGIQAATETIDLIARQTTMLALNAAIEAARAGESGRGFAVVAAEVRTLATRTAAATKEISAMVKQIHAQSVLVSNGMKDVTQDVTGLREKFHAIDQLADASEAEVQKVAAASEHNEVAAKSISGAADQILSSMTGNVASLPAAADATWALCGHAEKLFLIAHASKVRTHHETIRHLAEANAQRVAALFEEAIATGRITKEALFDRRHKPIAGTNPQKFTTRYDAFADDVLPAVQEPILQAHSNVVFAIVTDSSGYFPTHNRKFAKPLTGKYEVDLANNRTKRIFDDFTGIRCATHTEPFLLQTYRRDTGETLHDMSVPIFVGGKHWGAFRIGYRTATPQEAVS